MKQLLQTMGAICVLVLLSVGGFWFLEFRQIAAKSPAKLPPAKVLPQPVANAGIRRHIPLVMAVRPHAVTQWSGITENMAFSRDGRWLAQSTNNGVQIKRTKHWKRFRLLKNVGGVFAFSNDSRLLALQFAGVWRLSDGNLFRKFGGGNDLLGPVSFSPNDQFVATLAWPESVTSQGPSIYPVWIAKELKVWNLNNSNLPKIQRGLDSDDNEFSTIIWRNVAKVGQVPMWKAKLVAGHGDVTRVAGHAISVNMAGRFIQASDATTGELLSQAKRMSKIGPIALAPDATLFAGADAAEPIIYIWRLTDGKLLGTIKKQDAQKALALAFSSDAKQLAVSFSTAPAPVNTSTAALQGSTVIYDLNSAR